MTGIFSGSVQYSLPLLLFIPPREYSLEIIKLPFIPKVCMTGILSPTSSACGVCVSIRADSPIAADKHFQTTIPLIYFSRDSQPSCVSLPKEGESGPLVQREAATTAHGTTRFPVFLGFLGVGFPLLSQCTARREHEVQFFLPPRSLRLRPASEQ